MADVFSSQLHLQRSANLGLFTRIYPRKGTSDQYTKFWTNGESAVQKLAAAWVEKEEDTVRTETANEWISQLRAKDVEYETLNKLFRGDQK